jgi:glycosyltransferase involved in cell wall biosynthesis
VDVFFFRHARPILRRILAEHPDAVFHYLCPVSPILPRFPLREATNVLGPLTGNIYYPPAFRGAEPMKLKFGRLFHYVAQRVAGAVFGDKRHFGRILVSGGERTRRSLGWAGASDASMEDVVDSGISDEFDRHPLIRHQGVNDRFMTSGRLVPHKGVQLSIEALQYVTRPIRFDIYGDGYYREELEALAARLGVADKVRFMGWMESHDALIARMADYRGYLVPSLAEANGIVVQEAMMAGLPVISLKWGGPAMLADGRSAILIEPGSHDEVVRAIAAAMDALAADPDRANRLVAEARGIAERRFGWDNVADEWQAAYGLG